MKQTQNNLSSRENLLKGTFYRWKDECVFKLGRLCSIILEVGAFWTEEKTVGFFSGSCG